MGKRTEYFKSWRAKNKFKYNSYMSKYMQKRRTVINKNKNVINKNKVVINKKPVNNNKEKKETKQYNPLDIALNRRY